jgi:hypothetical protein
MGNQAGEARCSGGEVPHLFLFGEELRDRDFKVKELIGMMAIRTIPQAPPCERVINLRAR